MEIKFEDIWGQSSALSVLSQNVLRDRVASAYLFSGPRGTGKTKSAMVFAQALLCQSGAVRPCGTCRPCKMFGADNHPDFVDISPDGAMIKIEQMRGLMDSLSLKSYMGGRKVCVMHDAEAMNRTTANAFLKTLEEPPGDTALILVSSNHAGLLPTIISRCRVVRFVPMEPMELAPMLEERLGLGRDEALRAAMLAEGCPGNALGGGVESVRAVDDQAIGLMSRIMVMDTEEVVNFALEWKNRRADLPVLLERISEILRMGQGRILGLSSGTMPGAMETHGEIPGERIMECYDLLLEARPALRFNPNVQLFLEALIFNMQSVLEKGYPIGTPTY